jgi:putrescine importer
VDTAYVYVAGRAGGALLFQIVNITLLVANIGSGMAAHLGAARLLYGMGRDDAIPKSFFGKIEPKRGIPRNNVIFVAVVALVGALLLSYQLGAELLNFGAFIAFMGVNAASFVRYWLKGEKRTMSNLLVPVFGFLICGFIWLNLSRTAMILGAVWMGVGIVYGAIKTHGFRADLVTFDMPAEE